VNDFERVVARLRVPVIAAPMFLVSGVELVLAACRAGVVGAFPAANARTIDDLDAWCGQVTAALDEEDAPWALNIVAHRTYGRLGDELAVIRRHRPPLVISALGSPAGVVDAVHEYGGLVLADVATLQHAAKALQTGADGLVLVCAGAGGHTGTYSPFAFLREVRRDFAGPVVLSGGICDGRTVAAARVLGADLAYVGTRFIATRESMAPDGQKSMVAACRLDDLVVSAELTGAPANWLRPSLEAADHERRAQAGADFSAITGDERRRWRDVWSAGHGIAGVTSVTTVAEIVDEFAADFAATGAQEARR
jgi:nitronate monooxygenase